MGDRAQGMSDEGSSGGVDMRDDIKASASRLHALLHQSVVEIAPQGINRVSCGIDLIMPLPEPAMGCVASA